MENRELLTTASNRRVDFDDAVLIADRCFGELGRKTIFLWQEYNDLFFGASLSPTPVLFVPTSPYGHWVGLHCHQKNIYLMFPGPKRSWPFVRGVLLHEMIHQSLDQHGEPTAHASASWCREIMRISHELGRDIWAGRYTVKKINGRACRANEERPSGTRGTALNQKQISTWPHSINLDPPEVTYNYK
jgi:hypothetical protein